MALCAALLGGCGGSQSPLAPDSGPARKIAGLWWGMLAASAVVFLGAITLILIAWVRRRREGLPVAGERDTVETGLVVLFGVGIPVVALIVLFAISDIGMVKDTQAPKASSTKLTVEVVGRQWFWEVRYPGHGVTTANEIHIPARTRVNLVARTADVIHSFWVPKLNRKIDMIPGQTNRILLYADKPGAYRGQCAEFCGMQHANMALEVYADPPARFNAWLAHEARPAPPPTGAAASAGQKVFLGYPCSSCHTLRGSGAKGQIGPDLTHLASRRTLAALTIPNDPHDLARWIQKPQTVKPGNKMPGLKLSSRELRELIAFLEQTR